MYQSEIKNIKTNVLFCKVNNFLIIAKNDKIKYQHQINLIFFKLNIYNMKTDKKTFSYERIQSINKVNEESECFCKVVRKKKKFFN